MVLYLGGEPRSPWEGLSPSRCKNKPTAHRLGFSDFIVRPSVRHFGGNVVPPPPHLSLYHLNKTPWLFNNIPAKPTLDSLMEVGGNLKIDLYSLIPFDTSLHTELPNKICIFCSYIGREHYQNTRYWREAWDWGGGLYCVRDMIALTSSKMPDQDCQGQMPGQDCQGRALSRILHGLLVQTTGTNIRW